jgi:signal peptidase I
MVMAIVVALLFKYFVLEISKIPSGSMQPTLMGSPETGVFDRTLVDKLSYQYRDPERFEIVVFKHPLERSRVMVKRLVGMPGEELKIENGDLWTRPGANAPWRILRRPPKVQRAAWRELRRSARSPEWSVVRGEGWRVTGAGFVARGDGLVRFRDGSIMDGYLDGYPEVLADDLPARAGENRVADVRLEGEFVAEAGTAALTFELTEGLRTYEFTLPGPAAGADEVVRVRIRDSAAGTERVERGAAFRVEAGRRLEFAVENLDDRLALELEGRRLLAAEIEPSAGQEARLTLGVVGQGAEFDELRVLRDVYYTSGRRGPWSVVIPAGHYVMLGDNTHDSADGRLWESITYTVATDGGKYGYRGNYRQGENPLYPPLQDGTPGVRFRDEWGEVHYFRGPNGASPSLPGNAPLVPRQLVLGRALAVFWPINPFKGLVRLGWLH